MREHWYERFLWALRRGAIPAGRITSNAGALEHKPATSTINCTVSGTILDSMDDILDKVHEAGPHAEGRLRHRLRILDAASARRVRRRAPARTRPGPLSFMDIYDKMCFTVSSAGGRRGAQMGTFDVGHPDVMDFIRAKREAGRLRQFNLSLLITDDFMEAVENDKDWQLVFPVTRAKRKGESTSTTRPEVRLARVADARAATSRTTTAWSCCKIYKTLPARRLWDVIMSSTYDFAEPGFILIDRVNEMNNNWWCENIRATNPCGEQPLPPYGSCLLGSVNLTRFVRRSVHRRGALRLGGIPQGRERVHAHARQRGRGQRPAARPAARRDHAQAPPRHGLPRPGLARSRCCA